MSDLQITEGSLLNVFKSIDKLSDRYRPALLLNPKNLKVTYRWVKGFPEFKRIGSTEVTVYEKE